MSKTADTLRYLPDEGLTAAVEMAIEMEIPLFITGEPGTGKTELAYWIAQNAGYRERFGIGEKSERFKAKNTSVAKNLLYRYDAVRHFRDSQRAGGQPVNVLNYIHFEALGQAIIAARRQRSVVLVDEIDKTPRDFPNDLLFEFDKLAFRIEEAAAAELDDAHFDWKKMSSVHGMELQKPVFDEQHFIFYTDKNDLQKSRDARKVKKPVLVLTSNSEKNLPDAFLRRCAFYHIPFPEDKARLLEILDKKGLYKPAKNKELINGALDFFISLRKAAGLRRKPATAELIAWVEFLSDFEPPINPAKELSEADWQRLLPSLSLLGKNKEDLERIGKEIKRKNQD